MSFSLTASPVTLLLLVFQCYYLTIQISVNQCRSGCFWRMAYSCTRYLEAGTRGVRAGLPDIGVLGLLVGAVLEQGTVVIFCSMSGDVDESVVAFS